MSAPALAWLTAVRASSSSVGSLSTSKPSPAFDDDAAVAVAGVLAEADVGDEDELLRGCGLLERAQGLLHDAVVFPCAGALLVFGFGQAEEQQAADAELCGLFGFAHGLVDGEVEDAGHGADWIAHAFAGADKERIDEVAGLQRGLAHQRAQRLSCAAAGACDWLGRSWFDSKTGRGAVRPEKARTKSDSARVCRSFRIRFLFLPDFQPATVSSSSSCCLW